jgi:hypothetical protein
MHMVSYVEERQVIKTYISLQLVFTTHIFLYASINKTCETILKITQ